MENLSFKEFAMMMRFGSITEEDIIEKGATDKGELVTSVEQFEEKHELTEAAFIETMDELVNKLAKVEPVFPYSKMHLATGRTRSIPIQSLAGYTGKYTDDLIEVTVLPSQWKYVPDPAIVAKYNADTIAPSTSNLPREVSIKHTDKFKEVVAIVQATSLTHSETLKLAKDSRELLMRTIKAFNTPTTSKYNPGDIVKVVKDTKLYTDLGEIKTNLKGMSGEVLGSIGSNNIHTDEEAIKSSSYKIDINGKYFYLDEDEIELVQIANNTSTPKHFYNQEFEDIEGVILAPVNPGVNIINSYIS